MQLANAYHHFITITTHKLTVMDLCFRIGLIRQGILHDLSKYSPEEFATGIRYYQGVRSPNAAEKREKGYSGAWLHHKGRNKHHFEYWFDNGIGVFELVPVEMPLKYVKEMFCDRVAASKTYNKANYTQESPLLYLTKSTAREKMTEKTYRKLLYLLKMLAEKGEKETLAFMRRTKVLPEDMSCL